MAPEASCARLAFDRMMHKVQALPAADLELLYQKSGFTDGQHTPGNLGKILTNDRLAPPHDTAPFWAPVSPDSFLLFCRPDADDPADHDWRRLWRDLKEKYADGRI